MFFEGSEKKLELVFHRHELGAHSDLRSLGDAFFHELVVTAGAMILSKISNNHMTAYLLSESSLFVWSDRIVMITCGKTRLVDSAIFLIHKFGKNSIKGLIFQRKNEYSERLQETSFSDDSERLREFLNGTAYRFGQLDSHYNYVFEYGQWSLEGKEDCTCEILMYHIGGEAAEVLRVPNQEIEKIRELFDLKSFLPQWEFDDYVFTPYGYSLNGLFQDKYLSIHITPESEHSYLSFETNLDLNDLPNDLPQNLIEVFAPETLDVINFNAKFNGQGAFAKYHQMIHCEQTIECGLAIDFYHLAKSGRKMSPVHISGAMI